MSRRSRRGCWPATAACSPSTRPSGGCSCRSRSIPKRVISAFLATEDKNFYSHHGVDPISMLRAAVTDIGKLARQPAAGRRLDDHAAGRQEHAAVERAVVRAQDQGDAARHPNRRGAAEGPHPRAVPERDLSRLRRLWRGVGGADLFQQAARRADPRRSRLSRRAAEGAQQLQPEKATSRPRARRGATWCSTRWSRPATPPRPKPPPPRPSRSSCATARRPRSSPAPISPRRCAASCSPSYGEKAVYQGGLTVRTSLDARLQAAADKSLRDGLIAYDRARGGWRGVVGHIDPTGDWPATLAAQPLPAGAATVGWQLAMVTAHRRRGRRDRLQGRRDRAHPVRADALGPAAARRRHDRRLAAQRRRRGQAGRSGAGRAAGARGGQARARQARADAKTQLPISKVATTPPRRRAGPRRCSICARSPTSPARWSSIDPHTGRVLAMSGGFSFEISQFNRATQAKRQPGSSIKPFVYLTALEHGYTPSTLVLDAPDLAAAGTGPADVVAEQLQHPHLQRPDAAQRRAGEVAQHRVRPARRDVRHGRDRPRRSRPSASWTTCRASIRWRSAPARRRRCAIPRPTRCWPTAASSSTPTLIDSVQDRNGVTIFRADQRACTGCANVEWEHQAPPVIPDTREQIADPGSVFQIVEMMEGVVQRGTGTVVKAVGKPIAGKTGTTNDWPRRLVCRLHPRPRRRGLYRLRRSGQPRRRRDRRPSVGADLPRLHDGGAEGQAGDRVPHPAGHADVPGQPGDRR